jgi:hypothetical protein
MTTYNFDNVASNSKSSLWSNFICKPQQTLHLLKHCHNALSYFSKNSTLYAISFALAIAKEGGTSKLAQHMPSIQRWNKSYSLVNRPIEVQNMYVLVSLDTHVVCYSIFSQLSRVFKMAPLITKYSCHNAYLLNFAFIFSFNFASLDLVKQNASSFIHFALWFI